MTARHCNRTDKHDNHEWQNGIGQAFWCAGGALPQSPVPATRTISPKAQMSA